MKRKIIVILCALLALIALIFTVYPLISNVLAERNRSLVETRYWEAVDQMDTEQLTSARDAAAAYNETLLTVSDKAFSREALQQAAGSYRDLLNVRGDELMGYVHLPKIAVELPIYHGTEESSLDRGIGHLLGSSLPVGGKGTHCVLTGHSGLAGQKMFSDLDLLEPGDVFFLKILGETLAYKVVEINIVLPEDTRHLKINPKRDLCTLVTCTPYGVNSHRLLVTGERTEFDAAEGAAPEAELESEPTGSTWMEAYLRGICYGLLGVLLLVGGSISTRHYLRRRRKAHEKSN